MKKRILLALLVVAMLALSGCLAEDEPAATALPPMTETALTSRDELYEVYNKIDFNMTVSELEELLGPATTENVDLDSSTGTNLSWVTSTGITTVVAVSDGQIVGKAVDIGDPRTIAALTPVDFANVHNIETGMDYTQIVEVMGCEGVEILARINRSDSPVTITRLMRWSDENGNVMQILFNQDGTISSDDNSSLLYEFPTIEPGATWAPTAEPTDEPEPEITDEPAATEEPATDGSEATDEPAATGAPAAQG